MKRRLTRLTQLVIALFAILSLRLVELQVFRGARYSRLSDRNRIRKIVLPAPRGRIFDRTGTLLADTRPSFTIAVIPTETNDTALAILGEIINQPVSELKRRLKPIAAFPAPVNIYRNADLKMVSRIEENKFRLPGVLVRVDPVRNYPYGALYAHIIGHLGEITEEELARDTGYRRMDFVGRTGVEASYEKILRGRDGYEFVEVDARGREIGQLPERRPELPVAGKDIYLTIDHRLQRLADELTRPYERAAVIGISVKTGAVLCFLSRPQFDPNIFLGPVEKRVWDALITNPSKPFFNRVISSAYPPGSTFKPLVALAALKDGMVIPTTAFTCTGSLRYGNRTFKCWSVHGNINLIQAIENSCNVYFYQLGMRFNIDILTESCRRWGLGQKTGIDIPGEIAGNIPSREFLDRRYGRGKWTRGVLFNFAIGQGEILVTPIQLATIYAGIANNGFYYRPFVVAKVESAGVVIDSARLRPVKVPVNNSHLEQIKRGLTRVVESGTGRAAQLKEIPIAGKTGTAQNPPRPDHAWFVGYAPAENPEVVFAVILENAGHGGAVAAPIVRELVRAYFSYDTPR